MNHLFLPNRASDAGPDFATDETPMDWRDHLSEVDDCCREARRAEVDAVKLEAMRQADQHLASAVKLLREEIQKREAMERVGRWQR